MTRLSYETKIDGTGPVEVRGALWLQPTPAGVLPRRLPEWTVPQYAGPFMEAVTMMPTGVRLAFRTAARNVELDLLTTTHVEEGSDDLADPGRADLVVDGEVVAGPAVPVGNVVRLTDWRKAGRMEPGEPGTLRFTLPGDGVKDVEIWLPQRTPCELIALRTDAAPEPPTPVTRRRWAHYGSSISHSEGADRPTGTWPVVAARAADVEPYNLSLAGNAHLDPCVARTLRDLPADLISLKIGINIVSTATFRLRTFAPAVHGFLDTIRDGHPDTPLLLISPISCPALEDRPGPSGRAADGSLTALGDPADITTRGALSLTVVRDELARVVAVRDDPNLHYLDGRVLLPPEEAAASLPDHLHPDSAAYHRMGTRFARTAFGPEGAFARP